MRVKHPSGKKPMDRSFLYQDDLRAAQQLLNFRRTLDCQRCGGLLVSERMDSPADPLLEQHIPGLRCVQCGDILDQVILRNRMYSGTAGRRKPKEDVWEDQPEDVYLQATRHKRLERNISRHTADAA